MSIFDSPKPPKPPAPPAPPDTGEGEKAAAMAIAANKRRRGRRALILTRQELASPVAQPQLGTASPLGA